MKCPGNVFIFQNNFVSFGSEKLSVLLPQYWQVEVIVLSRSPKVSDGSENDFF